MKTLINSILFFGLLFIISCGKDSLEQDGVDGDNGEVIHSEPNILLIIADDMGIDSSPGYAEGSVKPNMPNYTSLMNSGLKFNNVWSAPTCTPTRATLLSGKYGIKSGVTEVGNSILLSETSLQKYMADNAGGVYETALIGKWHLSNGASDPLSMGIDYWAGFLTGAFNSYTDWNFTHNGITTNETEYSTTKYTDLAIDWVEAQDKPWFLWLAYNAAHTPFHLPPSDLHSQENLSSDETSINANPEPYFMAALEAMDAEMGRLFESISEAQLANTIIIFIGDNGTPVRVAQSPFSNSTSKGTLYQGGINVPMIVSGKGVMRTGDEDALINTTDLYATIANIAGSTAKMVNNSISFSELFGSTTATSLRSINYIDGSNDKGGFAVRNKTYKLINFESGDQEFYNLSTDPYESNNLLLGTLSNAEAEAKSALETEAIALGNTIDADDTGDGSMACDNDNSIDTSNGTCDITSTFTKNFTETVANDIRKIVTNGVPTHKYSFNTRVSSFVNDDLKTFEMDATPAKSSSITSILKSNFRPSYKFGVALNGVTIDPAPAYPFIFEDAQGEFNWDWVFEPSNNRDVVNLDCASAHLQPDGTYHYHVRMVAYANEILAGLGDGTTTPTEPVQIGWAMDGYPIIYKYGYDNTGNTLVELKSSYKLKDGGRPGDGDSAPCGEYSGKYTNDYEYSNGLGDLDECNGISRSITLNDQTFDYYYLITDDFPVISRCAVGTVNDSFKIGD